VAAVLSILEAVRSQVSAVLRTIGEMEQLEFPYQHSRDGVIAIRNVFKDLWENLDTLTDKNDVKTVDNVCATAFQAVQHSLDILGFLLRSTNVRNAFEVYGPLLRIARKTLGDDTKLIVSSEWNFSPFTFIGYEHLPGFVLIGLPASESANPFLVPLAGHELGHSLWSTFGVDVEFRQKVQQLVLTEIRAQSVDFAANFPGVDITELETTLFGQRTWTPARDWALRQAEEMFCDFVGLRVFGESYLHAFAYLLAPWREGLRSPLYPDNRDRAKIIADVAKDSGLAVPDGFVVMFGKLRPPQDGPTCFLLSVADGVRNKIMNDLADRTKSIIDPSQVPERSLSGVERCLRRFSLQTPAQGTTGLGDILNAAWQARLEKNFFKNAEIEKQRDHLLTEIVLKSIEILEIEERLKENP